MNKQKWRRKRKRRTKFFSTK